MAGGCFLTGEIFNIAVYAVLIILGVPGNCLILRVYWTKPRRTSTGVLIMGLAWADLLVSALSVSRIAVSCLFVPHASAAVKNFMDFLFYSVVASSILLTGVIAFDRYDCVCRPYRRLLNHRRALFAVASCVIFGTLVESPKIADIFVTSPLMEMIKLTAEIICFASDWILIILCYGKVYITIRQHVKVGVASGVNQSNSVSSQKRTFPTEAHISLESTANTITPVADAISIGKTDPSLPRNDTAEVNGSVPLTTSALPKGPWLPDTGNASGNARARQEGTSERPAASLQRKTTRMLLITSVVFLVSWVPYWTFIAVSLIELHGTVVVSPTIWGVLSMMAQFAFINHIVNPFIYSVANSRFRKDCTQELKKLRCR